MAKRYALRDDQWEKMQDLLPGRKSTVGVTAKDNRLFVEAVKASAWLGLLNTAFLFYWLQQLVK